jgi:radical SAM protein
MNRTWLAQADANLATARSDLDHSPMIVFYELTRACDLVCKHCRAEAQSRASAFELSAEKSRQLIHQLTEFPHPPALVLTGGDPLKRADIYDLIAYAVKRRLEVAITPSATPLVTYEALARLRDAGIARMAISLDGADAATHDAIRGVAGSYGRTWEIMANARSLAIPLQVNTVLSPDNAEQIERIADQLEQQGIVLWSLFFLVPVGRAAHARRLSVEQCESVFERLWQQSQRRGFRIKTTEAPHYRRFLLQKRREEPTQCRSPNDGESSDQPRGRDFSRLITLGINDGKGILFVSHLGLIYPSGFLPIQCGVFPRDHVVRVYQESPLFRALRDANRLRGKCGRCEYRHICGGSRARSFALTGDPHAQDPDCAYVPALMKRDSQTSAVWPEASRP